jgi:hypothetical protein
MPHLDEGTLHALVDGEIPSGELEPIRAHLAACDACRRALDETRDLAGEALSLVEALDGAEGAGGRPGRRAGPGWRHLAWAASVVLAAGLGYAAGIRPGTPPPVEETVFAAPEPVEVAVAPEHPAEPAPAPVTTRERDVTPAVPPESPPAVAAPATAARPEAGAGVRAAAEPAPPPLGRLEAREGIADRALAARAIPEPFTEVSFPTALERLGGIIRLIEGMIPERVVALGERVRVIYRAADGDIVLEQARQGDSVAVRLITPPSVDEDSAAVLRRRIR